MDSTNQRWLSLTGICTTLNIAHNHAKWLAKKGFLSYIPGRRSCEWKDARFLDPTTEYQAKLKLGEALYGRLFPIPIDINLAAMLTCAEIAEIMGWTQKYATQFVWRTKVPCIKVGVTNLYSMDTVRRLLWQRTGRAKSVSKQKSPFLVWELIEFFLKQTAAAEQEVPTDAEFAADELLERKLTRMGKLKSPARELAFADFYRKMELAKTTVDQMRDTSSASGRDASA